MESTSESMRERMQAIEAKAAGDPAEAAYDPTSDAYAQAELESRAERMERMIEKANRKD